MKVEICKWRACTGNFSNYIIKRLEWDKQRLWWLGHVTIEEGMCMWMCKRWPNVKFDGECMNYAEPAKVSDRVINWFKSKKKKFKQKIKT